MRSCDLFLYAGCLCRATHLDAISFDHVIHFRDCCFREACTLGGRKVTLKGGTGIWGNHYFDGFERSCRETTGPTLVAVAARLTSFLMIVTTVCTLISKSGKARTMVRLG